MTSYTIQTKLPFGKYKGKTVQEVISIDISYINFCLVTVDKFCMSPDVLNEIHSSTPAFTMTEEEVDKNIEKYWVFLRKEQTDNTSKYYPHDEENDYYNDNLDMDQQVEEFYTNTPERDYDYPDDSYETEDDEKAKMKKQLIAGIISNKRNTGYFNSIPFLIYFIEINGSSVKIYPSERIVKVFDKAGKLIDVLYFSKKLNHIFTEEDLLNTKEPVGNIDYFIFDSSGKKLLWSGLKGINIEELLGVNE